MKKASGVRYGILGTPVTQMTFLLLGALMKTVKAEEPEKSESVNLGQKLGNLSAGEKTFAVLGVLSLICLFVAMVTSLSKGGDSRNPHMHKIAATYVFSCFGYLLLVAFIVYGCYLYHSDGSVSTCQNGCLCFGILLFLSCLVLFALKIFKQTQTAAETALISDYVFIFLSVIFLIAFTLAACRQCYFKLPFGILQRLFIAFGVVILVFLILVFVKIFRNYNLQWNSIKTS
ncbi:uncharacterized protein BXIN_2803 [Babesia sp. Xinjiang]|uniref:uncharacterized protein n=1 Tax=Babesia sp. Xinjiang TaxID=462227 RepID=UPI000A21EE52|nr:uncharacterized protein BXIN_2803 [Babesia sp. Xinjiang]ORM41764.1 hypothetical protein BXIN_2803 [Babesia sp. Xinjiang]